MMKLESSVGGINGVADLVAVIVGRFARVKVHGGIPHESIIRLSSYIQGSFAIMNNKYVVDIYNGRMYLDRQDLGDAPADIDEYNDILKLSKSITLKALDITSFETERGTVVPAINDKGTVVWYVNSEPVAYCDLKYLTRHHDDIAFPTEDGDFNDRGWFYPKSFFRNMHKGIFCIRYVNLMLIPCYDDFALVDLYTKKKLTSFKMSDAEYENMYRHPEVLAEVAGVGSDKKCEEPVEDEWKKAFRSAFLDLEGTGFSVDGITDFIGGVADAFDKGFGYIRSNYESERRPAKEEKQSISIPTGTTIWKADSVMSKMFYQDRQIRDVIVSATSTKYAVLSTRYGIVGVVPIEDLDGKKPITECRLCTTCTVIDGSTCEFNTTLGQALDMILCDILPSGYYDCRYYPLSINNLGLVDFIAYVGDTCVRLTCDRYAYKNGYPESICK